jgi:diguanylate cyclase (GGDEF)-like protein
LGRAVLEVFKISIVRPIFFPLIFLGIVFISLSVALSYIEDNSKKNIHKTLDTVLNITEEALLRWSESQLDNLAGIVNEQEVISLTQSLLVEHDNRQNVFATPALKKLRTRITAEINDYRNLDFFVIAPDRINIASRYNANIGRRNIIVQHRKALLDRAFLGESVFIPTFNTDALIMTDQYQPTMSRVLRDKQAAVFIASPIFDESGNVIAVLALELDPSDDFTRIMAISRLGQTGQTYAFDKNGLLLTKSRFGEVLKAKNVITQGEDVSSIYVTDPGGNVLDNYLPKTPKDEWPLTIMAERAISGDAEPYMAIYRDYRGIPVFGSWLWNKTLGIGITTEVTVKEGLYGYTFIKFSLFIIFILITLLTLGLVFLLLRSQQKEKQVLKQHSVQLERAVSKARSELESANENLRTLSETDSLTKIGNRRLYEHNLIAKIALAKRSSQPLSLMIIDIDYFKPYNDNYGHNEGDITLKNVAETIANTLTRTTDFVARYGGEEFVVLMTSTDANGAYKLGEKIRVNIERLAFEHQYSKIKDVITVSIGISSLMNEALNKTELFKQADTALYEAKSRGRNQVTIYEVDR